MAEKKSQTTDTIEKLTFEQALASLQEIVEKVETGRIGLEEAIAQYETGCKLVQHCKQILEKAERKIEILSKGLDNKLTAQPFTPESDSASEND
ncbi:MAG: exodeoxyribonuclease VII small subunit [Phycisphaerae bacterium]|jgi:exodeoxyribonuclease VII small subunit|nr:exodeoxyribonuclease VII small subunit [Phycisphaerae bacterium]